jgi:hypothetical protein
MSLGRLSAIEIIRRYRPDSRIIVSGSWIRHSCIIDTVDPHHNHGDRNPSAGLNSQSGAYLCFAYSAHALSFNKLKQIMHLQYDFESERRELPSDFKKAMESKVSNDDKHLIDLRPYKRVNHQYMLDRGFLESTLDAADIRYDDINERIVIPVYEDGMCVGYQSRAIRDSQFPRYKNSKGFDKSEHVYSISALDESMPLIVFESPMSVMRAYDYGMTNCVATFGSKISDKQAEFINAFRDVLLWFDGDGAGQWGIRQAIKKLSSTDLRIVDSKDLGTKDIADISQNEAIVKIVSAKTALEYAIDYI